LLVQVRAHGAPFEGRLDGAVVRFARPQPRVAPGQVVALYRGDTLVGGGLAAPETDSVPD
jgi:tRNA-specific 2-thiouridylase